MPSSKTTNVIANPLAPEKLEKKIFKFTKKCMKAEKNVIKGVKAVTKSVSKRDKLKNPPPAVVILAGDVDPIDVYSHLPVLCEEKKVPYIFVSSRSLLGESILSKRSTAGLFLLRPKDEKLKASFDKLEKKINSSK